MLLTFKKAAQSKYGMTNSNIKHKGKNIRIINRYVVETKDFPRSHCFKAIASPNLFFKPSVKPTSKKDKHKRTEERVSQIPYNSEER